MPSLELESIPVLLGGDRSVLAGRSLERDECYLEWPCTDTGFDRLRPARVKLVLVANKQKTRRFIAIAHESCQVLMAVVEANGKGGRVVCTISLTRLDVVH